MTLPVGMRDFFSKKSPGFAQAKNTVKSGKATMPHSDQSDSLLRSLALLKRQFWKGLVLILTLSIGGLAFSPLQAADFLEAFEDVPLMPGLVEQPEAGLIFDSPEGRIVTAYAQGNVGVNALYKFYHSTLPNMGWHAIQRDRFHRDREMLQIKWLGAAQAGHPAVITFTLTPR